MSVCPSSYLLPRSPQHDWWLLLVFFQGQNGWRVLQTGQGEGFLQCETQTCNWNSTSLHFLSQLLDGLICAFIGSFLFQQYWPSSSLSLHLTDSVLYKHLSGCWRNNTPGSYSNISRWVPVLPAVNNSDPFFYSTESKAGSEDLKRRMENDHHRAYCTSTVCTIWQWLISHFYNLYLLPVFVFNWFRPVVYCELVQSGYYVDVILFKSGMKNYILSHPLIALA